MEATSPLNEQQPALKNFACTYFNAIPEIPLATLGAAATMLLGLGFYGLVQRKKIPYVN